MSLPRIRVEIPDDDYWQRQIKCQYACPVHTDARGYVRAIAAGEFERAYLIARGPNPLASICGRVCGAPCEAACRRGAIDDAVSIRALKRFVSERYGPESFTQETLKPIELLKRVLGNRPTVDSTDDRRHCTHLEELGAFVPNLDWPTAADGKKPPAGGKGKRVAIIGSGPAGLAAAHDLALLGHMPTIFEMEPIPAGMLAVGIPEYRLPRDLIAAEVEVIRSLGVEFVCNTQVVSQDTPPPEETGGVAKRTITLESLRQDYAATIIAVGAKHSRAIPIPGGDGPGVLGGVEFLRDVALNDRGPASTLPKLGKRVLVIGGGNVAYDVSRTLVRQIGYDVSRSALRQADVGEVHLCCLESVEEMPADDLEIVEGHEEGVVLHPSLGPVEVLRDAVGNVKGMALKRVLSVFDDQGRFAPKFDDADITRIEVDTIVWAIGQQADLSFVESDDLKLNERGLLNSDPDTLQTTAKDVFLAGDIAYGPRLLIDAVASGKKCARAVHTFLTGQTFAPAQEIVQLNLPDYVREQDYEKIPRTKIPTMRAEERRTSQSSMVETGYSVPLAVMEAHRCLDCGVNTIFDSEKCILCGGCADVCPELCLKLVSCDRMFGDDPLGSLMRERYGGVDLADMSAIVKDEEKCIRCALCAERCPVGAITMERFSFSGCWSVKAQETQP